MNLTVRGPDGELVLAPTQRIVLGRDPACAIVLADRRVSREHAEIAYVDGGWRLRDLGSHNGTFAGARRVSAVDVGGAVTVRLGDPEDGPRIVVEPADHRPAGRRPGAVHAIRERLTVGRDPDNDLVLPDLLVSRHHAELRLTNGGLVLADLDSRNGTYRNGQPVDREELIAPGDVVSFGRHEYVFDGHALREPVDTGHVVLAARDLVVRVAGRTLLDEVSFDLAECGLLAVVGPSGAGKSTLLGALIGSHPVESGQVTYEGRDLYRDFAELRHRIGIVPQEDILHRQLTVRRALSYAAQLRFPQDVGKAERSGRINEALDQLDLAARAGQRIDTLSGGQRKRTSVALELLTEPSLLLLDEPTSGLDPALDREVMRLLRSVADGGCTVVVVTHSVLHLDYCDRVLLLAPGGRVGYFGDPDGLLDHFGVHDHASAFAAVAKDPQLWARRAREALAPAGPVATDPLAPGGPPAADPLAPSGLPAAAQPPRRRQDLRRQVSVLSRRMVAVASADRLFSALTIGLPLGLAALAHAVPGSAGLGRPADGPAGHAGEAQQLLVVLVVGAVFMGMSAGIRELVGERPCYERERAVGLSPVAYLTSKVLVLGLLGTLQAAVFVLAALLGRPGPADALVLRQPMVELIAVVAAVTVTSTATGLLVSATVRTAEQVMPILVGWVMAQLVLCGGLFTVVGRVGLEQLSWLAPARWGYAAAAATVDIQAGTGGPARDSLWRHSAGAWLTAVGVLAVIALATLLVTRRVLARGARG